MRFLNFVEKLTKYGLKFKASSLNKYNNKKKVRFWKISDLKIELRSHNDQEEDTIEEIDIDQTIKIEAGTANDGIFSFKLKKISVLKIYSVFKN